MGCYIRYSEEGLGRAAAPPSPLLAVPNVTARPSMASVPITGHDDGPLLCGYNVAIKGLMITINLKNVRISNMKMQVEGDGFVLDVTRRAVQGQLSVCD